MSSVVHSEIQPLTSPTLRLIEAIYQWVSMPVVSFSCIYTKNSLDLLIYSPTS